MGLFGKSKEGGLMDVIRCDEPDYLIWKWHPAGSHLGHSNRENAIRWGSSLRVKDGEVAVFVYNQRNGVFQDYIEGPFDQPIKTMNFPVISKVVGMAYDGGTPFQAEVYFINLARIIQTRFAVSYFDIYDPRFLDFGVPVAVRGTISFNIVDYQEFIKLHRLNSFDLESFQKQVRDVITRYTKDIVANAPTTYNIPVVQIETKIAQINDEVELKVGLRLKEDFGVNVTGVDIGVIEIDKTSNGYQQLLAVTKDVTTATVQAQTAAKVKDIHDKQRIEAENYQENLRIQREEGQYAMHKQTQSANIGAFQVEKQAEVGIAAANALGQMGGNEAGSVELGRDGGSMGFNPAAMMASMAVGSVVGQNIAGTMNGIMSQTSQSGTVPPPVPSNFYHIAMNGQATGPYDYSVLQTMASNGQLTGQSLVWKQGMAEWKPAGEIQELADLFINQQMPPIPPAN